jgi:ribonuclease HI
MKALKLDHQVALAVAANEVDSTWRLFDDKDLSVNDVVRLVDKVDPARPESWRVFGTAAITQVIEKQLASITIDDMESQKYGSPEQMLQVLQGYYGGSVTLQTPVKILHFTFQPMTEDNQEKNDSRVTALKIFADGGSRGNPGPSASGYVLLNAKTDEVIVDKGVYIGVTTNNQAEYQALKFALEEAHKMSAATLDIYMDSLLVTNQMKGIFKIKNRDLWPVHDACRALVKRFKQVSFTHVPRAMNKLADSAVNRALDEQAGSDSGKVLT